MTRAHPLPTPFDSRAFSTREALAAGLTASRLRAKDLFAPTRGVRNITSLPSAVTTDESDDARLTHPRERLFDRTAQVAPALTPGQFFSHDVALALVGAPLPYTHDASRGVHISAHRPAGQPRRAGTIGHRLQLRDPAIRTVQGLPVEHPARAWRQVATSWSLDDLIAAGDFLVLPRNGLTTVEELRAEVEVMGDTKNRILTRAIREIRIGAETAEETRLRLALVRAGLPEPELNLDLRSSEGRFIARLDLAYPTYRVGVEHDGRVHAFDVRQFARDADRWDDIRAQGWAHVRILSHHLHPSPRPAIEKVTAALIAAGWRARA